MSFAEHRQALVDSVFDELGEDATWSGVATPVRVRIGTRDVEDQLGSFQAILRAEWIRVRKTDVPLPAKGDVVALLDDAGAPSGVSYKVAGDPQLTRNSVWLMPVSVQ